MLNLILFFPSCREPDEIYLKPQFRNLLNPEAKIDKSWQPILQNQILLKINFEPSHGQILSSVWLHCLIIDTPKSVLTSTNQLECKSRVMNPI